jgi:hypothetical protein
LISDKIAPMNDPYNDLVKTARLAGICYLGLAITGVLGFVVYHPQVYDSADPAITLKNLSESASVARIRLLLEFGIIISQALAAIWFYKLFRGINEWGAWSLGIWGTVNSAVIMVSAIAMGAAIDVAGGSASQEDKVVMIQLLTRLSANAWAVGGLFFGLWLIPMGYVVMTSKRMPPWLGRVLILGGVGYLLSTFISYLGYSNTVISSLTIPATVGEFWMIGYLLIYGIREESRLK